MRVLFALGICPAPESGGDDLAFPHPNAPCPNVSRGLVFPRFSFYPMTMMRIGIVMIDSTVVTKVP